MTRLGLVAVIVGLVLRVLSAQQHDVPRGDVVLDVGVARSLVQGDGFRSGFTRAVPVVVGAETALPPQGWADQHPPLWPLVGAALSYIAGDAFGGLKLGSWLAGLALLLLVWRCADRLSEGIVGVPDGIGPLAAGVVALSYLMVDGAGNGSLYSAQAALILGLIAVLSGPRRSALRRGCVSGLLLGLLGLLNHQALVLLPAPLLVGLLTARPGERREAVLVGLLALGVAALCFAPWWWRNAQVFGNPTHSVNQSYLLYKAGVAPSFLIEQGQPVIRLAGSLAPLDLARAMFGFLKGNAVYFASTCLLLLPCLGGVLLAGLAGLLSAARLRRDARLTAILVCVALLLAVNLAWPAAKQRYLVTLMPLLVLIGMRVLAQPVLAAQRRWAAVVVLAWAALLLATLDDLTGSSADPRPERWWTLLAGGSVLMLAPLFWQLRGGSGNIRLAALSGLPIALLGSVVMLLTVPGTGYHSTVFAPDAFGRHTERQRAAAWDALTRAHEHLVASDSRAVLGPIELLAWSDVALLELPRGAGPAILGPSLHSLLSQPEADHVVLSLEEARALDDVPLTVGTRWFDGQLEVVAIVAAASAPDGEPAAHCVNRIVSR
jgi:hypothetical protein